LPLFVVVMTAALSGCWESSVWSAPDSSYAAASNSDIYKMQIIGGLDVGDRQVSQGTARSCAARPGMRICHWEMKIKEQVSVVSRSSLLYL
jgi:hypothetical protein